jgi:hypothetical protein
VTDDPIRAQLMRGPLSPEEYRKRVCDAMLEKVLQSNVAGLCKRLKLGYYHTYDSRRSPKGFPDCVIWGPGGVIFRELKREKEQPKPHQVATMDAMREAGQDVGIWRPSDWFDDTIERELRQVVEGVRGAVNPLMAYEPERRARAALFNDGRLRGFPARDIARLERTGKQITDVPLPEPDPEDPELT